MRTFLIAFFFTCLSLWAFAQDNTKPAESVTPNDSILFNNGKVLETHVIDTTGDKVTIEKPNSSKHKKIEIDRENIFSVRYGSNHKEVVMYIYDTLTGHDFTVADARLFIAGEQDAQKGYHPVPTSMMAFAIGAASGLTGTGNSFFVLLPPIVFSGIVSIPRIHIRHKSVANVENVKHDPYLYGYDNTARRKRTLRSLVWGGIGVAAGLAYFLIFIPH